MTLTKRKLSLSLDDDLIAELETRFEALSAQVNDAIRTEISRRKRHKALVDLLDHLAIVSGPLDSDDDEKEIARYMRLLGGSA